MSASATSTPPSKPPVDTKIAEEEKNPQEGSNQSERVPNNGGEGDGGEAQENEDDNDDDEECGICEYIKGGECKEPFIAWQKCADEAEKNNEYIGNKCLQVYSAFQACMAAHSDYYGPLLMAQKAMEEEEEAVKELAKGAASMAMEQNAGPKDSENKGLSDDL